MLGWECDIGSEGPIRYRTGPLAAFMPVRGVAALKNVNFETDSKTGNTLICYNSEQLTSSPLKELRRLSPRKPTSVAVKAWHPACSVVWLAIGVGDGARLWSGSSISSTGPLLPAKSCYLALMKELQSHNYYHQGHTPKQAPSGCRPRLLFGDLNNLDSSDSSCTS